MEEGADRHLLGIVAGQSVAKGRQLGLALQRQQAQARAGEQRQGHAEALVRHTGRQHRQAVRRAGGVERRREMRAAGKQRGGVAILAHAQHQHVDRLRQPGQRLVGLRRSLSQARLGMVETDEARRGRLTLQQVAAHQALVAVGMADRHPALVGQADRHFRPVEGLRRQALEDGHRAAPAGHHQAGRAAFGDGRAQGIGHGDRQFTGELQRVVQAEADDLRRQVEITDRHTSSCHHG
ncbi:hypothetical protein D9M71_613710 [compost metagenome]